MQNPYIKLNAKRKLVKHSFKSFLYGILPYVTIVLLCALNYYLYIFLKNMSFGFITSVLSYEIYIKATLLTIAVILSFLIYEFTSTVSQRYFYLNFITDCYRKITFRSFCTFVTVSVLKFFLSIAWGAFFLLPGAVVGGTLYYSLSSGEYTFNVNLTLFVAGVILLFIGLGFFYTTLKRYSMCSFVIFSEEKTEAVSVINKSINLMEGNILKYAVYSVSFLGWVLSCVLIIPVFYVLPYIKMAKYSYFKAMTKSKLQEQTVQKPIIFYIKKKA